MTEQENKKLYMVGNLKMALGRGEDAVSLVSDLKKSILKYKKVETVVCPSFVHIGMYKKNTFKNNLQLGAQNVSWNEKDSLTGEVSAAQLQDFDVKYCIVGHSERRKYGETDFVISQKIQTLLKRNITPILCVGEETRDEKGMYLKNLEGQIKNSLQGILKKNVQNIMVAYEPLWAIGKDAKRSANGKEIEEIAILIKRTISDMYGFTKIPENKILYGGSVSNKKDLQEMVVDGKIDGFLIGRASLFSKTFLPLIEEANRLMTEKKYEIN